AFDGLRRVQLEGPEGEVVPVAAQVAHRARTEVPPAVPLGTGEVDRVEGPHRRGADPEVPVEVGGNRHLFLGPFHGADDVVVRGGLLGRLEPPDAADPDVALGDLADRARLDELDHAAVVVARVDLRARLGGDLRLLRGVLDDAGFPDAVGEGLLAVDMLAHLEGGQRREGVGMLGDGDDDGVEVLRVVEDLAEVLVLLRVGVQLGGGLDAAGVDVADRDDVLAGDALHVRRGLPAGADAGDVELGVGRLLLAVAELASGDPEAGADRGAVADEFATIGTMGHGDDLPSLGPPAPDSLSKVRHRGADGFVAIEKKSADETTAAGRSSYLRCEGRTA